MYVYICMCKYVRVYMYVYICMCIYIYVCVYIVWLPLWKGENIFAEHQARKMDFHDEEHILDW